MLRKLLVMGAGVTAAAAASGAMRARMLWRRWGVDAAEAVEPLPGDDLVADAEEVDTRGIDIAAPPDAVWPWLVQMGYGRAGWYSYDQLDMNHPSADRILPEHQSLAVGDLLPTDPGGGLEVKVVEPGHALVAYIDRALVEARRGPEPEAGSANVRATGAALDRAMPGDFAASWAVVLEPRDGGTRLIERFRARIQPGASPSGVTPPTPPFVRTMLGFGVFVMTRRQMLGIRDRVEGRPVRAPRFVPGWRGAA